MCRLWGAIKLPGYLHKNDAWLISALRCMAIMGGYANNDATGVMSIVDGKLNFIKEPMDGEKFTETDDWKTFFKDIKKMNIIVGHNRAATTGPKENNNNNHPVVDSGVGVTHNGVISNFKDVAARDKIELKYEVDTEILLRLYLKSKNIKDVVDGPSGSFNFVILDETMPNKVQIFKHNPGLHIMYLPKRRCLLYATSDDMLKACIVQRELGLFERAVTSYSIRELTTNYLYTIDISKENDDDIIDWEELKPAPYWMARPSGGKNGYRTFAGVDSYTEGGAQKYSRASAWPTSEGVGNNGGGNSTANVSGLSDYPASSPIRRLVDSFVGQYINMIEVTHDGYITFTCDYGFAAYIMSKFGEWGTLIADCSIVVGDESIDKKGTYYYCASILPSATTTKDAHNKLAKLLMEHDNIFAQKKKALKEQYYCGAIKNKFTAENLPPEEVWEDSIYNAAIQSSIDEQRKLLTGPSD